ncbi:MAG TPA: TetR/AcrR family transcriptional regulator [Acidimicrobiales bacterium]|nr:TetR/AcrR family transcriptional regulator [Acidimicrobiales bacterium]
MTAVDKTPKESVERRSRLPAPIRRDQLLDAARALVLEAGTEAVTMESVAAAAGVSKTLGYAYFDNRTELLLALFDREVGDLQRRAAAEMADSPGLTDKLRAAVRVWFDVVASEGGVASVLLQSSQLRGRLGERRQEALRSIEELYGRQVAVEFGVPEERAVVVMAALIAALGGVIDRWTSTGEPRELVESVYLEMADAALRQLVPSGRPAR